MKWNNTIKNSKKITIILDNIIFYVFIANFVLLKLIKKKISNTELYIEDFLNYYDASSMEEGCYRVDEFLGDWYIRKCMWSTAGNLKTTSASIKKFYQCMLELGHIDQEHYDELQSTIKDHMDIWIEEIEEYNSDCFDDLDFLDDLDIF